VAAVSPLAPRGGNFGEAAPNPTTAYLIIKKHSAACQATNHTSALITSLR
jgi:hypothetical protein